MGTGTTLRWADGKTEKLAGLIRELHQAVQPPALGPGAQPAVHPLRLLVVGCGSGLEALILAQSLQAAVVGIDLQFKQQKPADEKTACLLAALQQYGVRLQQGDATALEFEDESFDLIYSYHVLEHIPHYRQALKEMHRVLRTGGAYLIGTPNRARLLGYLGSKDIKSWRIKFASNWRDWQQRLQGSFRNTCGAHAGFTRQELKTELLAVFRHVRDITPRYYRLIYPRLAPGLRLLNRSGLEQFVLPAIYFWGYKLGL
jgi:ubiquinone/menaquinone biosynthesis C-methylase UbiE